MSGTTYHVEYAGPEALQSVAAEFGRPEAAWRVARTYADQHGYAHVVQACGETRQVVRRILNASTLVR